MNKPTIRHTYALLKNDKNRFKKANITKAEQIDDIIGRIVTESLYRFFTIKNMIKVRIIITAIETTAAAIQPNNHTNKKSKAILTIADKIEKIIGTFVFSSSCHGLPIKFPIPDTKLVIENNTIKTTAIPFELYSEEINDE